MATNYSEDSAFSQMVLKVPTVQSTWDLKRAQSYFHQNVEDFDTIRYLYVVNKKQELLGIMSLKDIFRHDQSKTTLEVCKKDIISVKPETHQERVVYLALKHNIKAIPVVDENNLFLGVVPSDKILSILYKETKEDILRFAGIHTSEVHLENTLKAPLRQSYENRIPWLVMGMFGGILSAKIIGSFEGTLEQNVLLAAFIPLVVYMSNAVAMQVQTLYIRDQAAMHNLPLARYFLRHLSISLLISITVAGLFFVMSFIGIVPTDLGRVVGISIFLAINLSVVLALSIPYILNHFKVDPALGSGPVSTIIQDTSSVVVYFTIASLLL